MSGADSLSRLAAQFNEDMSIHGVTLSMSASERRAFAEEARRIIREVGSDEVRSCQEASASPEISQAWLASLGEANRTPVVLAYEPVVGRRVRFCLYAPAEDHVFEVTFGGALIDTKVRSVEFFGEHWVFEHNLIVDTADPGSVRFADRSGRVEVEEEVSRPRDAQLPLPRNPLRKLRRLFEADWWGHRVYNLAMRVVRSTGYLRRFEGAWIVSDRRYQANDNGEVLFRYLHAERPDINAWFVVDRSVPVYRELRSLGAKVLPYRSLRHFLLVKSCRLLACSETDFATCQPFYQYTAQTWLFVYLKHGIIHTDHHRRLNPIQIHLLLAGAEGEQRDLTREGGSYRLASSEVPLTGMPRFDRLAERAARHDRKDLLLIAPTWRRYLAEPNPNHSWSLVEGAEQSAFARQWRQMLQDPALREACGRHGLTAVFLVHPRFQEHPDLLPVPEWIETASYRDDVSSLFARTALAVTDYSSIAFEVAYVGSPTVYFQFDRDEFYSGAHSGQPGDFAPETQGFGPCVERLEAVTGAIETALGDSLEAREYRERIESFYGLRDSRNCERAVAAIERLERESQTAE